MRTILARLPLGLASQICASGTNFLLLVALARTQGADKFGWAALGIAVLTAAVGISRTALGTSIALAAGSPRSLTAEGSYAATVGTAATALLALPWVLWAVASGNDIALSIALACPVVVLHDLLRQVAFSGARPAAALVSDLGRLLTGLGLLGATLVGTPPGWALVALWGLSAAGAAAYLARTLGWVVFRGDLRTHWGRDRGTRRALLGDSLLIQSTPVATSLLIGGSLSAAALSGFRGGSTLLGPISILLTAVPLLLLPRMVQEGVPTLGAALRRLRAPAAALSIACLLLAGLALVLPDDVGEAVLGDSWSATAQVLPIMAVQFALQPWALSVSTGLRLIGRADLVARLRLVSSLTVVLAVAVAVTTGSVVTVVLAILAVDLVATCVFMALGRYHRGTPVPAAATGDAGISTRG